MRSGGARTKAEPRKTVSDEVVKSDASQPSSAPSGDVPKTTPAIVEKPAPAKSEISMSELDAYLVNFVVEQTGYPEDMVDLDADLEGDLGIDSIKKAQLLGELNEKFHFSTTDDMNGTTSLDDFATLRSIRDFIVERTGASPAASSAAPAAASVPSESAEPEPRPS